MDSIVCMLFSQLENADVRHKTKVIFKSAHAYANLNVSKYVNNTQHA